MTHAMVDIETLATSYDAAVISIGAVKFDPMGDADDVHSPFHRNVRLQSAMAEGQKVDADTVLWWMKQSEVARDALYTPTPVTLGHALFDLATWYKEKREASQIWAHGSTFDIPILAHAYKLVKKKPAWHWRDVRDTRTLFNVCEQLAGEIEWPRPPHDWQFPVDAHNPLADAARQALAVQEAYRKLRGVV